LILRLSAGVVVWRWVVLSCIRLWLWENWAISSVKLLLSGRDRTAHCIPLFLPDVMVLMIQSMTRRKKSGKSRYHFQTSVFTSKLCDIGQHEQPCMPFLCRPCVKNQGDKLIGYSIVSQYFPQCFPVYTLKLVKLI
jgi:hypothetical protein